MTPQSPQSAPPAPPAGSGDPVVLPDGVGNRDLDRLIEIVPPEAVAWTPQTVGWYVLAALALGLAIWALLRLRHRWVGNRYRREALAELALIERDLERPERREDALASLPSLLKRTALASASRSEVASLTGTDWLAYLDSGLGGLDFETGDGRVLLDLAYRTPTSRAELGDEQVGRLLALARRWIRKGA